MTFKPPPNKALQKATTKLQQTFNERSRRYISPSYQKLRELTAILETKYNQQVAKQSGWFGWAKVADKTRLDQIGCITQLLDNLPESSADDKEINQAKLILLGALLYRYFRISGSYTGISGGYGLLSAENSALKRVLHDLLNINNVGTEANPENKLDELTIATCCQAYYDYLKQKGVSDKYTYISKDDDFFINLKQLIDVAEAASNPVKVQMQYIVFIQSVTPFLLGYEEAAEKTMSALLILLTARLKEKPALTIDDVMISLKTLPPSPIITLFEEQILPDEGTISQDTIANFKSEMDARMAMYSQYALLGAYVLSFEKCKEQTSCLFRTFQYSLGITASNVLDDKARKLALDAFQAFVEISDISGTLTINTDVWGGTEFLKKELTIQLSALAISEQEETATFGLAI